jgi:ComF family protein
MFFARFIRDVLDFCYPGVCAACGAACDGGVLWCAACDQRLAALRGAGSCPRCAMPLPHQGMPCPYCLGKGLFPYERIARLGVFAEPLRGGIHHAKYHRRWELGEALADRLYEAPGVAEILKECDGLLPVPLHWRRQIGRGYNQAQVLAGRLGRRARRPVLHAAVRARNTPTQTQLRSRTQRHANLRDAFILRDPAVVAGRRIVVVDDVMTSGATLQSLGRTLRQAKPAALDALVLAIADPRGQGFERI